MPDRQALSVIRDGWLGLKEQTVIAMDRTRDRWAKALNEGSADEFARCVTPAAVWLPPRGDAVEGREALVEWLEPLFEQYQYEFSIRNVDVRQLGDWAVEEADFRSVLHSKQSDGGGALVHDGRYLLIWRRTSDDWLIDRYVDRTGEGAPARANGSSGQAHGA